MPIQIEPKRCVIEIESWEDKVKIPDKKSTLGKRNIHRPSMTMKEREIQKKLLDIAKAEKMKGEDIKVKLKKKNRN